LGAKFPERATFELKYHRKLSQILNMVEWKS
jgi:hypothetical protein